MRDLNTTTVVADRLPLIQRRTVDLLLACDHLADAVRNDAGDHYVEILRNRAYQALVRLNEAVPGGIRDGLWPEFQIGLDQTTQQAKSR